MLPPEFSVIVPVYNSAASIVALMEETEQIFNHLKKTYELVLVNDFSTDESLKLMLSCKQERSLPARIINLKTNSGQYATTLVGMYSSSGSYLITIDADFSPPPSKIEKLIQSGLSENTLIYGEIMGVGKGFFRTIGSTLFNSLVRASLNKPIKQNGSSFRLISAALAKKVLRQIHEPRLLDIKLMNAASTVQFVPLSIHNNQPSTYSSTQLLLEGCKLLKGIVMQKINSSKPFAPQNLIAAIF